MVDGFGRAITYLRVSVTDRCDLKCRYCRSGRATYRSRAEILSLEELDRLCSLFIAKGITKLRITGGEPLVRRGVVDLLGWLSRHLGSGQSGGDPVGRLSELTLTTNGTHLAEHAGRLAAIGIRRINVSCDTLEPEVFRSLTMGGRLAPVLAGIAAAAAAGIQIKINTVVMKGVNDRELDRLIGWCGEAGHDLTLIELMPFGEEALRVGTDHALPLTEVMAELRRRWTLTPLADTTGGPARYHRIGETGGRLGMISPLSRCFCATCNRVRLTCDGRLHLCLGRTRAVELRALMQAGADGPVGAAIDAALAAKPEAHGFCEAAPASAGTPMSAFGG